MCYFCAHTTNNTTYHFMRHLPPVSVYLEKRFPSKLTGLYPVKIRVTYKGVRKYFSCNAEFTEEEFERTMSTRPALRDRANQKYLLDKKSKIESIIQGMKVFSWEELKSKYYDEDPVPASTRKKDNPVYDLFDIFIENNYAENRVGNAKVLQCAKSSFMAFRPKLRFEDITKEFLLNYERWFLDKGNSISTVGIYMRALRSIYNAAISDEYNLVASKLYPFYNNTHRKGYKIPKGLNIKKALTLEQIEMLMNYPLPEGSLEDRCRDFWYFTYLNNGINHKDIAELKYKHIINDEIHFERSKTIRSRRDKEKTIIAILFPESKKIIEKWGNKDKSPNNYVFPILRKGLSAKRAQDIHYTHLQTINKFNNRLAKTLGLNLKLTTMTARHTFASVMVENNVDISKIQSMMGHSSSTTTEIYVKPFNSVSRKETASVLLKHKNADTQQENPE